MVELEDALMIGYSSVVERQMVTLYGSLSEKERRRYAAVEAVKFGHGGVQYIAALFGCDPHTIRHGAQDIEQLPTSEAAGRVRKSWAIANIRSRPQETPLG